MKLVLSVAGGVLIAGMLIWWISDPDGFRHKLFGYSQDEINASWDKVHENQAALQRKLDAEILDADVRLVELRHGAVAAATYRLCHTNPPTTKQHQVECRKLDEQFKRDQERAKKNPW